MTNLVSTVIEQATPVVSTNINQVLIEMLSGVKSASGEIYGASKEAIHKSVDFIAEQAPDIIHQFCTWRFFDALVLASIFLFVASMFALCGRWGHNKIVNAYKDDHRGPEGLQYIPLLVGILAASLFFIFGVGSNVREMVKIKVAPKVYVIEYVVDAVKEATQPSAPAGR